MNAIGFHPIILDQCQCQGKAILSSGPVSNSPTLTQIQEWAGVNAEWTGANSNASVIVTWASLHPRGPLTQRVITRRITTTSTESTTLRRRHSPLLFTRMGDPTKCERRATIRNTPGAHLILGIYGLTQLCTRVGTQDLLFSV